MLKYWSFISGLYDAVKKAPPDVRDLIRDKFEEARETGTLPIGLHRGKGGDERLLWLVFDRSKYDSAAELDASLRRRTPKAIDFEVVLLQDWKKK